MNRAGAKLVLRVGLMGVIGIIGIVAVSLLSRAMTDITRSDETASIFNVAAELHHDLIEAVEWLPDADGLLNDLPPLVREQVTETWLRAWAQPLILSDGNGPAGSSVDGENTDGILEYFGGSAIYGMIAGADGWLGTPVHQIGHDLRLNFYSDDGSVISITAERTRLLRGVPVGDRIEWYDTEERFHVVFVLEQDNWRIHYWKRVDAEGRWVSAPVSGSRRALDVGPNGLRSVTWLPSNQSPEEFWTEPDEVRVNQDMAAAAELGFNSVRVELPYELLGGREVSADALRAVRLLADAAHARGLSVVASLLAGRTEHQPLHWDADDDHLDSVIAALGDHPALVLWELSAGPDTHVGIERVDQSLLNAWLSHTAATVRAHDDDTPLTIGWSTPRAAAEAPPIVDVVSFAWTDLADVAAEIDHVRNVADGRPIIIADAVQHTHVGLIPGGHTETEQARWFADMVQAAIDLEIDGFSVSSLRDVDADTIATRSQAEAEAVAAEEDARIAELEDRFPAEPTPEPNERSPETHPAPVVAEVTWPVGAGAATGVLRVDGSAKPAAGVFAPGADLASIPTPGLAERILKPFNVIVLFLVAVGSAAWLVLWLWARRSTRLPRLGLAFRMLAQLRQLGPDGFPMARRRADPAPRDQPPLDQVHIGGGVAGPTPRPVTPRTDPQDVDPDRNPVRKPLDRFRQISAWLTEPVAVTREASPSVPTAADAEAPYLERDVERQPGAARSPASPEAIRSVPSQAGASPAPSEPAKSPTTTASTGPIVSTADTNDLRVARLADRELRETVLGDPISSPPDQRQDNGLPPAPTLDAEALSSWPDDDMQYEDVGATVTQRPESNCAELNNADTTRDGSLRSPSGLARVSMIEVDLQPIDTALAEAGQQVEGTGPVRYAAFVIRALCVVAAENRSGEPGAIHVAVDSPELALRVIADVEQFRLGPLRSRIAQPAGPLTAADATVGVRTTAARDGLIDVAAADPAVPMISLAHLDDRPVAVTDQRGGQAVAVHSMGLLSIAAAANQAGSDAWLRRLREILETRDWATELS